MSTEDKILVSIVLIWLVVGGLFEIVHEIKRREWAAEHPANHFVKWGELPARLLGWPVFVIAVPALWLGRAIEGFVERKSAPARIRRELMGRK